MLNRLVTGQEVDAAAWQQFGLQVLVDEDTDDGEP